SLRFLSKSPGSGMRVRPVSMDFNYGSSFGERTPTAYETLLVDAMSGDPTLYTRQDMVEASWQIVQPILDVWANTKFDFPNYAAGTATYGEFHEQRGDLSGPAGKHIEGFGKTLDVIRPGRETAG